MNYIIIIKDADELTALNQWFIEWRLKDDLSEKCVQVNNISLSIFKFYSSSGEVNARGRLDDLVVNCILSRDKYNINWILLSWLSIHKNDVCPTITDVFLERTNYIFTSLEINGEIL